MKVPNCVSRYCCELAVQVELYLFHGKYFHDFFPCHKFECLFNVDNLKEF